MKTRVLFSRAVGPLVVASSLASCASPAREGPDNTSAAPLAFAATESRLETRANALWEARLAEDWETVFEFRTPEQRQDAAVSDFVAWSEENEPFVVRGFEIEQVCTENDLGWVKVDCLTSLRRYEGVPPRENVRWEKWRHHDGDWYPVAPLQADQYPAPPPLRDAEAEQALRARVDESWAARRAEDWDRLFELNDPEQRAGISIDEFAAAMSRFEYISHDVRWVEAIGDRGRAQVAFQHRLNDPSMTKAVPQILVFSEAWVKVDGDWYLAVQAPQ